VPSPHFMVCSTLQLVSYRQCIEYGPKKPKHRTSRTLVFYPIEFWLWACPSPSPDFPPFLPYNDPSRPRSPNGTLFRALVVAILVPFPIPFHFTFPTPPPVRCITRALIDAARNGYGTLVTAWACPLRPHVEHPSPPSKPCFRPPRRWRRAPWGLVPLPISFPSPSPSSSAFAFLSHTSSTTPTVWSLCRALTSWCSRRLTPRPHSSCF
jgi:hypothetical protein